MAALAAPQPRSAASHALARDFSGWLDSGKGSDVTLSVVADQVAEAQPSGTAGAAGRRRAPPSRAAKRPRTRRVLREYAAHSLVLEEASAWAAAMLGSPESREVRARGG